MVEIDLKTSMQQYRAILEHARQLENILTRGADDVGQLTAYSERLQQLQQTAGLFDHDLLVSMSRNIAPWRVHPLFDERLQLQQQIVELNEMLLPRVYARKAMLGAELEQLKKGSQAVSGYGATFKKDRRGSHGRG